MENVLDIIRDEMSTTVEFDVDEITGNTDPREIGSLCEEISQQFRCLAICRLLTGGDTNGYYHDLIRSGCTRLHYLKCCHREEFFESPRVAASRSAAFFDALAAHQFELVAEIGALSARQWRPDDEYEEDFCYAHFLHRYLTFGEDLDEELEATLQQFETALEGDFSARLTVCRALLSRDQQEVDDAFTQLIDARNAEIEADGETMIGEEMTFQTERRVFVEGLAILNVAERIGLETAKEYQYCPGLARAPMTIPFPDDGYPK